MNSCILNEILLDTERFSPIAKNHLLKDLIIPAGYFVNNVKPKPIPIIYNCYTECIDDKCMDTCLKLIEVHEHSSKTKNNKPKKRRKTRKKKNK